jgi:uncharacterized integral membrane protein
MTLLILCIIISFIVGYVFCGLLCANKIAELEQELMILHQLKRED